VKRVAVMAALFCGYTPERRLFLNKIQMDIKIPTLLSDITVGEYQKWHAIQSQEDGDEDFLLYKTIEIFCDVDIQDVLKFPQEDAESIATELAEVLNQPAKFTPRFTLEGVEYGFIPNLEKLSLGEYIDLETYLTDTKDLHRAAAVMYRPILKDFKGLYTIEGYEGSSKYAEVMKRAPIDVISQAVVFFYSLGNELLKVSLHSLEQQEVKILTTLERLNSQKSTDGSTPSMLSVMEMLQKLQK
jgi:hypothetical protein